VVRGCRCVVKRLVSNESVFSEAKLTQSNQHSGVELTAERWGLDLVLGADVPMAEGGVVPRMVSFQHGRFVFGKVYGYYCCAGESP
jgi:hypothetical protein